jgi:Zn finger protein HypA/HybF involved in hydrogenase expression
MRYECNKCYEIIDEGDLITDENEGAKLCPKCRSSNITRLDDSEYGN